jgi:hypothetical protein
MKKIKLLNSVMGVVALTTTGVVVSSCNKKSSTNSISEQVANQATNLGLNLITLGKLRDGLVADPNDPLVAIPVPREISNPDGTTKFNDAYNIIKVLDPSVTTTVNGNDVSGGLLNLSLSDT